MFLGHKIMGFNIYAADAVFESHALNFQRKLK